MPQYTLAFAAGAATSALLYLFWSLWQSAGAHKPMPDPGNHWDRVARDLIYEILPDTRLCCCAACLEYWLHELRVAAAGKPAGTDTTTARQIPEQETITG